jgi:two-component system sensor histidine kinase/response regulator
VGLDDVIIKPVNPSILFDSVVRILGGQLEEMYVDDGRGANNEADLSSIVGAKILVAEDNELNQEVAMGLLSDAGFVVTIANNGEEAVNLLKQHSYDIVLMDMQMPVMDGVSATQEIRKSTSLDELPIVAMTANAMTQDKERCLAAGMNDHVAKPIDPEELFRTLLRWIKPRANSIQKAAQVDARKAQIIETPLPDIEGLDVQLGLKRVLNKVPAYISMLRKFLESQATAPTELRSALANKDMPTAERIAHTAKAVCGNIGASALQHQAEELERLCGSGAAAEAIAPKLNEFEAALIRLCDALASALPPKTEIKAVAYDINLVKPVVQKIMLLLSADDSEACDLFEENVAVFQSVLDTSLFIQLEKSIKNFDFEKALFIIKENDSFNAILATENRSAS